MRKFLILILAAFLVLSLQLVAQNEPRPGVQAPGFWLISPDNPTSGAVGLECVENMQATYTIVFPADRPTVGQSLVITSVDERTRRVYTMWQAFIPTAATTLSTIDVDIPTIPQNSSTTMVISVPAAVEGAVVSLSPQSDLPDGIIIGSARVVEGGKVQVRFVNVSAAAIHMGTVSFKIAIHSMP